jgi:hypothetical protein
MQIDLLHTRKEMAIFELEFRNRMNEQTEQLSEYMYGDHSFFLFSQVFIRKSAEGTIQALQQQVSREKTSRDLLQNELLKSLRKRDHLQNRVLELQEQTEQA